MDSARKAALYLAIISTLADQLVIGEQDLSELEESLALLGHDTQKILFEMRPIEAIQHICRAFGELKIEDGDIENIITHSRE